MREPVTLPGPDPFTQPISFPASTTTVTTSTSSATTTSGAPPTTGPAVTLASTSGSTPGLYGGTMNLAECNKEQLITFLEQNPDKGKAWAQVEHIQPSEIRSYIGGLTPVVLTADTRVTNHGFVNAQPTPHQSVLQKGTAVLVDKFGVPRARCYCGNPLLPPVAETETTSFTGPSWPAFDPGNLQVVTPAPEPITTLKLVDVVTGAGIDRPVGTAGTQDVKVPAPPTLPEPSKRPAPTITTPASTVTATTKPGTTTAPTASTRPASIPAPNAFIQKEGAVTASTTYSGDYPASLAVDGNPATSWFSSGRKPGAPPTTFTWTYTKDELITRVKVVGNGANSTPNFRKNFGFGSVTIRVLDANGKTDFEQTVALPGTPDPDVVVQPGVTGRTIQLTFDGDEAPDCGGFAELEVGVTR